MDREYSGSVGELPILRDEAVADARLALIELLQFLARMDKPGLGLELAMLGDFRRLASFIEFARCVTHEELRLTLFGADRIENRICLHIRPDDRLDVTARAPH